MIGIDCKSPKESILVIESTRGKGTPAFDRVVSGEAPNINAVAYYVRGDVYYVGVTFQVRPFADTAYGVPADLPIKFAQPVMGFPATKSLVPLHQQCSSPPLKAQHGKLSKKQVFRTSSSSRAWVNIGVTLPVHS